MDVSCSINGENYHYGTPTNPCAPDRVPGGSSSGSAVAVAANLVDFSLGFCTKFLHFFFSNKLFIVMPTFMDGNTYTDHFYSNKANGL